MTNDGSEVLLNEDHGVMTITINRPAQHNAMTLSAGYVIASALDELDSRTDLTIGVITGAGGTFCSGMDLKRFVAGETANVPGRGFGGVTERPPMKPLIAAVEGFALAGGFELLLACDMVVSASSARFGLPEVRRGLVARGGGLLRLPTRIPRAVAMEMILTGNQFDAGRAADLGLINYVVPDGGAFDAALRLARTIAKNAPLSVAMSKRVVGECMNWPQSEWFERQRQLTNVIFGSEDAKEGARAFAEKRQPNWVGK